RGYGRTASSTGRGSSCGAGASDEDAWTPARCAPGAPYARVWGRGRLRRVRCERTADRLGAPRASTHEARPVSETLFSDQWYRVADTHPRLRPEVEIQRQRVRDQRWYLLVSAAN